MPLFFSESNPGFISQVSPMKKAKKSTQYFHCSLQTSPTKTFTVVGFDQSTHTQCQHYEKTGNPVKRQGRQWSVSYQPNNNIASNVQQ